MLTGMQTKLLPLRRQQLSVQLQREVLVEMLVEMLVELLDLTCRACLAKEVVLRTWIKTVLQSASRPLWKQRAMLRLQGCTASVMLHGVSACILSAL
mmetsp:Transcript_131643/g.228049  ORF Transcript_131643/g.228049 Transcript_131643/m.228049 type:complete len:97 (+) Transcript_131643:1875-2165(+)